MRPTTETNQLGPSIEVQLSDVLEGHVCIVGIGNRHRCDDAAGPQVIDLRRSGTPGVWIDAGVAPENYLELIARAKPDTVLLVDAVDFGGSPGDCRITDINALETAAISTHAGSLRLLGEYLSIRNGVRPWVLAIQPQRIEMGEGLSEPVASTVGRIAVLLSDLLSNRG
ncbi:MAG: hydrogenase maturation protease [Pirellulaceae bacterium]|nr:hydrogenase maturation protease [Pirellulaceae bacterium]